MQYTVSIKIKFVITRYSHCSGIIWPNSIPLVFSSRTCHSHVILCCPRLCKWFSTSNSYNSMFSLLECHLHGVLLISSYVSSRSFRNKRNGERKYSRHLYLKSLLSKQRVFSSLISVLSHEQSVTTWFRLHRRLSSMIEWNVILLYQFNYDDSAHQKMYREYTIYIALVTAKGHWAFGQVKVRVLTAFKSFQPWNYKCSILSVPERSPASFTWCSLCSIFPCLSV